MNIRERLAATFAFQPVDRPMLDFDAEPDVELALLEHLGLPDRDALCDYLGVDLVRIAPEYVGPELDVTSDGVETDVWGVKRRPVANASGAYMEPFNLPWAGMTSRKEVEAYPWPEVGWYDFSAFPDLCRKYSSKAIIFGRAGLMDLINGVGFGRGVEQVMLDVATRDDAGMALFEKRFEFMYGFAEAGLKAAEGNADILFFGEDLGTQNGLIVSPATWREVFRPYMKRMIDLAHRHGAKAMTHSCGSVAALIPEFIDLGLDALQAVQPKAAGMAPHELASRFGGRLVFDGTMDIQDTLPNGTVHEVRLEVRMRESAFHRCGGFILGPCHKIQSDTPIANVLAMYKEGREERRSC